MKSYNQLTLSERIIVDATDALNTLSAAGVITAFDRDKIEKKIRNIAKLSNTPLPVEYSKH